MLICSWKALGVSLKDILQQFHLKEIQLRAPTISLIWTESKWVGTIEKLIEKHISDPK